MAASQVTCLARNVHIPGGLVKTALGQIHKDEHWGVRNQFKSLQTLEGLHSDPLSRTESSSRSVYQLIKQPMILQLVYWRLETPYCVVL